MRREKKDSKEKKEASDEWIWDDEVVDLSLGDPDDKRSKNKRMACVGGFYSVEPFVRTTEDIIDEALRGKTQERRPAPINKRLRADLTMVVEGERINGKFRVMEWLADMKRAGRFWYPSHHRKSAEDTHATITLPEDVSFRQACMNR